jgi:hypothetical protein
LQVVKTHRDVERKAVLQMEVVSQHHPGTANTPATLCSAPLLATPRRTGSSGGLTPAPNISTPHHSQSGGLLSSDSTTGSPIVTPARTDSDSAGITPGAVAMAAAAAAAAAATTAAVLPQRLFLISLTEDGINVRSLPDVMLRFQVGAESGSGSLVTIGELYTGWPVLEVRRLDDDQKELSMFSRPMDSQ